MPPASHHTAQAEIELLLVTKFAQELLGWPKNSFGFFHHTLWKNPSKFLANQVFKKKKKKPPYKTNPNTSNTSEMSSWYQPKVVCLCGLFRFPLAIAIFKPVHLSPIGISNHILTLHPIPSPDQIGHTRGLLSQHHIPKQKHFILLPHSTQEPYLHTKLRTPALIQFLLPWCHTS